MKSHRQQVHVEGEWHPYEPSTTQSFDTEWDSQSTWPTSFMLNMHISSPREVINPHPCVGRSYRSHPVCESVTALSPALFTLRLQPCYQDEMVEVMYKLPSLVLKIFV